MGLLRRGDFPNAPQLPRFLRLVLLMGPSGIIAMLAGWFVTEVGRQPWVVYNIMRTVDGASGHGIGQMSVTLALFVVDVCLMRRIYIIESRLR